MYVNCNYIANDARCRDEIYRGKRAIYTSVQNDNQRNYLAELGKKANLSLTVHTIGTYLDEKYGEVTSLTEVIANCLEGIMNGEDLHETLEQLSQNSNHLFKHVVGTPQLFSPVSHQLQDQILRYDSSIKVDVKEYPSLKKLMGAIVQLEGELSRLLDYLSVKTGKDKLTLIPIAYQISPIVNLLAYFYLTVMLCIFGRRCTYVTGKKVNFISLENEYVKILDQIALSKPDIALCHSINYANFFEDNLYDRNIRGGRMSRLSVYGDDNSGFTLNIPNIFAFLFKT